MVMKTMLLALAVASLGASDSEPATISLTLEGPATVTIGEYPTWKATITNSGKNDISIVKPGDGSESGWRTPYVGWSVLGAETKQAHPDEVPLWKGLRCGNMNALNRDEIVTLKPGDKVDLSWLGSPEFPGEGQYRVKFYYRNIPDHKWKGGDLGSDGPDGAVKAMRASTPCFAASNEVVVSVTAKKSTKAQNDPATAGGNKD